MTRHRSRWMMIPATGALLLASCGGGAADGASSAADQAQTTTIASDPRGDETTDAGPSTTSAEPATEPAPVIFDVIETEPNEPGPRPELSWSPVDGAAAYDLIVLDAERRPYWGWSGADTSVHLGGVSNPEAIGAWVFEPLTWIVTARDGAGRTLAVSQQAALEP